MERILAIVREESVLDAIQREPGFSDPVRIPADDGAVVRSLIQIAIERVEAVNHIRESSVAIRSPQRNQDSAIVRDSGLHAIPVGQRVDVYTDTVARFPEASLGNSAFCSYGVSSGQEYE
jgi:hypothetical protein